MEVGSDARTGSRPHVHPDVQSVRLIADSQCLYRNHQGLMKILDDTQVGRSSSASQ